MKSYEQQLKCAKLFKKVFGGVDEVTFNNYINNNIKIISQINTSPIVKYNHNIVGSKNQEALTMMYQCMKQYLSRINLYTGPIQEGLALFISKFTILEIINPNRALNYFIKGDYSSSDKKSNPYEEIARLLLLASIDNSYGDKEVLDKNEILKEQNEIYVTTVSKAINGMELYIDSRLFDSWNKVARMFYSLKVANISSDDPENFKTKENREVLEKAIDVIDDIYYYNSSTDKIFNLPKLEAQIDAKYDQFQDIITCAKSNMGLTYKTKIKK